MPTAYLKNTSPQGMVIEYDSFGGDVVTVSYSRVAQDQDALGIAWWVFKKGTLVFDPESLRTELYNVAEGTSTNLLASGTKKATSGLFTLTPTISWGATYILVAAPIDKYNILAPETIAYYDSVDIPVDPGNPTGVKLKFTHDLSGVENYGISVDRVQVIDIASGEFLDPDSITKNQANVRCWFTGSADRVDLFFYDEASCTGDVCTSLIISHRLLWLEYDVATEKYYVDVRLGPGTYRVSYIAYDESPTYGNGYPVKQRAEETFFVGSVFIASDSVIIPDPTLSTGTLYKFQQGTGADGLVAVWDVDNSFDGLSFDIVHTSGINQPAYTYSGNAIDVAGVKKYVFAFPVDPADLPLSDLGNVVTITLRAIQSSTSLTLTDILTYPPQEVIDYINGKVHISNTGIYGWNGSGQPTFSIGTPDGSGFFGNTANGNISWNGDGDINIDGSIITQSISAANLILRKDPSYEVSTLPYKLPSALYSAELYDNVFKVPREVPVANEVAGSIAPLIPNILPGEEGIWVGHMQPPSSEMGGISGGDSKFEFFVGGKDRHIYWDGSLLKINGSTIIGGGNAVSAGKGEINGVIIGGVLSTQGMTYNGDSSDKTEVIPDWAADMSPTEYGRNIYFGDREFSAGGPSIESTIVIDYSMRVPKDNYLVVDTAKLGYSAFDSLTGAQAYAYLVFEKDQTIPGWPLQTVPPSSFFSFAYIDGSGDFRYQSDDTIVPETDKTVFTSPEGIEYTTIAGPYVMAELTLSAGEIVNIDWYVDARIPGFYRYNIDDSTLIDYDDLADPVNFDKYADEFYSKGINGLASPALGDVLTITNVYNDGTYTVYPTVTKLYALDPTTGLARWEIASLIIDGNVIVKGSLKAKQFSAYEASMVLQKAGLIYSRTDVSGNLIGHVVENETNTEYSSIIDTIDSNILARVNNARMVINLDEGYIHIR